MQSRAATSPPHIAAKRSDSSRWHRIVGVGADESLAGLDLGLDRMLLVVAFVGHIVASLNRVTVVRTQYSYTAANTRGEEYWLTYRKVR